MKQSIIAAFASFSIGFFISQKNTELRKVTQCHSQDHYVSLRQYPIFLRDEISNTTS